MSHFPALRRFLPFFVLFLTFFFASISQAAKPKLELREITPDPLDGAAVDPDKVLRHLVGSYDFESGYDPDAQGWATADFSGGNFVGPAFHVDDFAGLDGGLSPIAGVQSLWCGTRDENFHGGAGYGDDWYQVFQTGVFAPTDDVGLSFKISYDLEVYEEEAIDFLFVQFRDPAGDWAEIAEYSGQSGVIQESYTIPAASLGATTQIAFFFRSDASGSDESDWNYTVFDSEGAVIIDDLEITHNGGEVIASENFEGEVVGSTVTDDGFWTAVDGGHRGDFAALYDPGDVLQEDPNNFNDTHFWGFFDDPSSTSYACGGHPEQGAVPYENEWECGVQNAIVSPMIDLSTDLEGNPLGPEVSGTRVLFDVYMNLPLEAAVFYQWRVRSLVDGQWTTWSWHNWVYYGEFNRWLTRDVDLSPFIDPQATAIQVAAVCWDLKNGYNLPGECHTQGPLFDNIQIERYDPEGPRWKDVDRFADVFQIALHLHGAENARVILDDQAPDPVPVLLDALTFEVQPAYPATGLNELSIGVPEVLVYVRVTRGDLDTDPAGRTGEDLQSDDVFIGDGLYYPKYPYREEVPIDGRSWYVYGTWQGDDPDDPHDDYYDPPAFHFDLNDFTGSATEDPTWEQGDVVHYFFAATDNLDRTSYFSHEMTETTADITVAAANASEFSFLPGWEYDSNGDPVTGCENKVLLVESSLNLETRAVYEDALSELGWCWDRFDNPANGGGLDLALGLAPGEDVPDDLYRYQAIIYTGTIMQRGYWEALDYPISDYEVLLYFLSGFADHNVTGLERAGLYLAGPDMASDWDSYEAMTLHDFFDFQVLSKDQTNYGLPLAPQVVSTESWSADTYALGLASGPGYDVLNGTNAGLIYAGQPASQALTWHQDPVSGTTNVIGNFGLEAIEGPGMATMHLGKTLEHITGVPYGANQVPVRISTVPEGITLSVDDLVMPTPAVLQWAEGSDHTISLAGTTASDGSEGIFLNWEDGQVVLQREVTVPIGATELELTAQFLGARQIPFTDQDAVGETSGAAWADFDGDGFQDVYLCRAEQPDLLLHNTGGDQFWTMTEADLDHGNGSQGAAWGDYDNDGDPDLYLVTEEDNHLYRNDGAGAFTEVTAGVLSDGGSGRSAAWADFDLDGDLDLYLTNFNEENHLLRNDGAAGFADASTGPQADSGASVAGLWQDYDLDGYPDLYIVNDDDGQSNRLLHNDGGTGFTDVTTTDLAGGGPCSGAAWGDYDNDGAPDLCVVSGFGGIALLRNEGEGAFTDVTGVTPGTGSSLPTGANWGDYDNDGILDLYRSSWLAPNSLLLGVNESGQYAFMDRTPPPLYTAGQELESIRESAWADFNNDGYLDALLTESSATYPDTRIIANAGQQGHHWLQLDLEGSLANRDGVGARVVVVTVAGSQHRQLFPSSGGAQSSRLLHFGLGDESLVQQIDIHWPGGDLQTLTGVAADQLLTVVQETTEPVNTEPGTAVVVEPVDEQTGTAPVAFTFEEVVTAGSTTVTVTEPTAPPPSSYQIGDPPVVYELETTATYSGSIDLCFDYTGMVFTSEETDLRVFHFNVDTDGDGMADSWGDPLETWSHDLENDVICVRVSNLSPFAVLAPVYGQITGQVLADCPEPYTGLPGVIVDVFSAATGDLIAETQTGLEGGFTFADLAAGDYTVSVVSPIGYVPSEGEIPVTVTATATAVADFQMQCASPNGNPRGTGYWKHQVGVALGGHGNSEIPAETLCEHLDTIAQHFNNNAVNQVVIYQPDGLTECLDKLEMAKSLLNLKGQQETIARARQHFMATLLNVAAGNLLLFAQVSEDGATLSQAITFCDYLVDDPEGDHELAKDIAETINKGFLVAGGVIPLDTENIAYRISNIPQPYGLQPNRPNPFNPATTIAFSIPHSEPVRLAIYAVDGRLVRTLIQEPLTAGTYRILWSGVDDRGSRVASGVYFYQLVAGDFVKTRKMMLLK